MTSRLEIDKLKELCLLMKEHSLTVLKVGTIHIEKPLLLNAPDVKVPEPPPELTEADFLSMPPEERELLFHKELHTKGF